MDVVAQPSPSERTTDFHAVEGGEAHTSSEVLLISAYSAMWLLVLLFVGLMVRRQKQVEQRLATLEKALDAREQGSPQ